MVLKLMLSLVLLAVLLESCQGYCLPRDYGLGSVVCVDDLQHCDLLGPEPTPPPGHLLQVTSDKAGQRWNISHLQWRRMMNQEAAAPIMLIVDRTRRFQEIVGFGGAFTDAAALNIHSLPQPLQDCIVRSYFGTQGLDYGMGRVPIGGSDFSTRAYTYDDLPEGHSDQHLQKFALQPEDLQHKIPLIQAAQAARGSDRPLKLVGSAWSAPVWMKDGPRLDGKGKLLRQYWATWAQYIVRFVQLYKQLLGVPVWAVTAQNEPTDGLITDFPINAMGWTADEQAQWVGTHLGPSLKKADLGDTKIFVLDDNRLALPQWLQTVMSNNASRGFVSGVAVHWYVDWLVPASLLDDTHKLYPDVPILYTEACTGQWPWQPLKVVLGSWQRAQGYVDDIIDTLNHWSVGWIDWNLALDLKGGPNWAKNFVDAPIIVNAVNKEVYKQPMYYAIGHVTKFIVEGSVRVALSSSGPGTSYLQTVSFERPDGSMTLVLLNKKRSALSVELRDGDLTTGALLLPPSSITTLVW